jgi:collagenase-like PrtC family protease
MDKKRTARFTVAFNGDDRLIHAIAGLPGMDSVFGKMSQDIVGGGRPAYALAEIGMEKLRASIRTAHEHGLKFYYLLNSACMANQELSRATNRRISALMDDIVEAGVDGVVVSMPYLLALAKRRYPKLKVSISTFAGIDSSLKARLWADRGADRLILSIDANRNRSVLEKIRQAVTCELEVFANAMCTYQCPFGALHAASNGHSSSSADALKGFGVDYHSYLCAERRLKDPSEYIRGRFVRPEDLGTYEEMGIDVFKLSDRLKGTPWLVRAATAYTSRRYDGNLADLISYPVFAGEGERPLNNPARFVAQGRHVNAALLKVMQEITKCVTPVYIDNRKLDGFLAHYLRHDCGSSLCGVDCRYCESVAARAVTIEPDKQAQCLSHVSQVTAMLEDQRAFSRDHGLVRLAMTVTRALSSRKNHFGNIAPE